MHYPGRPLRRGSVGEDVRTIERQLNRIGRNYPAIPAITRLDGVFGPETESAVRTFQQIFSLDADGVVGKATWYKIKEIYNGVKKLSELTSEGLTISETERQYESALRPGDSGVGVRTVRYYLAFLGYFLPQLPPIRLTDTFDQEMLDAVYAFQSAYGLPVDGIVGRETWNALQDAYQSTVSQLPEEYQDFAEEVYPGRFLVEGDRGEEVRLMQERLRDIARAGGSIPLIAADGVFGPATREAVQALQRQLGLEETGAVGPVLWAEIMTRGQEY